MATAPNEASDSKPAYEVSVYKPFKSGLPELRTYFRNMWRRRELAIEMARSSLRAQNSTTVLGQLWLVLNPLFLGAIYYTLVVIISGGHHKGPDYLAHLLAGLFAYHFLQQCLSSGATSVTGGGKLITNRAFPRLLLPLTEVLVAARRFLPTLFVYGAFHLASGLPLSWKQLLSIPAFFLIFIFTSGLTALLATAQVYFRDTKSFLPYVTRIWMYISPILYFPESIPHSFQAIKSFNPLYSLFSCWGDALVRGEIAAPGVWLAAVLWSFGFFFIGIYVFLSREREFAVRI